MRALTVRQPWAEAIASGRKDVENRTWTTHVRGTIAIIAGLQVDDTAYENHAVHRMLSELGVLPNRIREQMTRGAIIATVELVDVVTDSTSPWAFPDHHHWLLANARRLSTPIPYRGSLSMVELAEPAITRIEQDLNRDR